MAAVAGWASAVAARVDGIYVAVDHDVLDEGDGWSLQTPEPNGLSLETAARAIRTLASAMLVVGFGATGINLVVGGDRPKTVDAVATLVEAALGDPA
jgi:arginase family enzyme